LLFWGMQGERISCCYANQEARDQTSGCRSIIYYSFLTTRKTHDNAACLNPLFPISSAFAFRRTRIAQKLIEFLYHKFLRISGQAFSVFRLIAAIISAAVKFLKTIEQSGA